MDEVREEDRPQGIRRCSEARTGRGVQEAKQKAGQIKEPSDLWDLEDYLTRRRKEINSKYDSRGSRLTQVLGKLLYEGRLGEQELRGLG